MRLEAAAGFRLTDEQVRAIVAALRRPRLAEIHGLVAARNLALVAILAWRTLDAQAVADLTWGDLECGASGPGRLRVAGPAAPPEEMPVSVTEILRDWARRLRAMGVAPERDEPLLPSLHPSVAFRWLQPERPPLARLTLSGVYAAIRSSLAGGGVRAEGRHAQRSLSLRPSCLHRDDGDLAAVLADTRERRIRTVRAP